MPRTARTTASARVPARGARTAPARSVPDWDRLLFTFSETDEVLCARGDTEQDPLWSSGEFKPWGDVALSPAAAFFSYGIGIFEGLKAQRAADGRVLLFRPRDNAVRFQRSADRLVMAPYPADRFVGDVEELVRRNLRFLPPHRKGSFYVRPLQHGIEPQLGIRPSREFQVIMFGSPVGGYFGPGVESSPTGLRLRVIEQARVAAGGTGAAKVIGNYAGGLAIAKHWKTHGFDDVIYLDGWKLAYLTETSGANVFVRLKSGVLVTHPLDDQILAGVTRDSAMRLAGELGVTVEQRPITPEEAADQGVEVFCTGTAYTVQPVRELVYKDRSRTYAIGELQREILDRLLGIQRGDRPDPYGWVAEVPGARG